MKTSLFALALTFSLFVFAHPKVEVQKQDLNNVITQYMTLKDAFVASDAQAAQTAAKALKTSLMAAKLDAEILESNNKIAASNDLKTQRAAFKELTSQLILVIKNASKSQTVYVQYCPMASANWLSLSEEIRNPYYGDMMLKCGKVQEEL